MVTGKSDDVPNTITHKILELSSLGSVFVEISFLGKTRKTIVHYVYDRMFEAFRAYIECDELCHFNASIRSERGKTNVIKKKKTRKNNNDNNKQKNKFQIEFL